MKKSSGPKDVTEGYAFNSPVYAWFLVAVLTGLGIASYMDRQILTVMVEPLRHDFGVTDVQIGLLQGFAFTLFYAIVALPIGRASDYWSRKNIVIAGAALWSAATLLCMSAKSYQMLFVGRMLVGIGEAALIPSAISMLGDAFPSAKLSSAIGVVAAGSFLGSGATFALGGLLIMHLPKTLVLLPLVGAIHGWQLAFGIVSMPGIVLTVLMVGMREPPRRLRGEAIERNASLAELFGFLKQNRTFCTSLILGMALLNANQFGLTNWAVAFFMRTYAWSPAKIGVLLGFYFVILGPLASFTGGFLCDRVVAKRGPKAMLSIPLWSALLALPLAETFALNGKGEISAGLLSVLTFIGILPLGPGLAAVPLLAPNRMRAQLTAAYLLIMNIVGAGGGPWLVAAATDYLFHDPGALKYSIALIDFLLLSAAAACFWIGYRRLERARPINGEERKPVL